MKAHVFCPLLVLLLLSSLVQRSQAAMPGERLSYGVLTTQYRVKPPVSKVDVLSGPEEAILETSAPGRWWQLELFGEWTSEAKPLVVVRALTDRDPLVARTTNLRFARYQVRIPETGEVLEYRDAHTGRALLPGWRNFERYFVPAPASATRRTLGGAPQTCEYLGHVLTLQGRQFGVAWERWDTVKVLNLDREMLVGTGRPFKDAEGHRLPQRPERHNYTYVPFVEEDYRVMMDAGMNLFTVTPGQEQWVRSAPVFYLRGIGGEPKLRFPADLYRANYLGPVMFMDEPSILMVDDPNIHNSLKYFSDAAALIEKRTRTTYQSTGSYGAWHLERALRDAGVNLGDMRLMQEDYPSWETYYDTTYYQMKGGGIGFVHEGRYKLPEFNAAVEKATGEKRTLTATELLRYYYAFLRGGTRPFGKFWGTAIYGQCATNLAPQALTVAYDMGARYFWFWTSDHDHHVPWPEQLELARALKAHARSHRRPSIYGRAAELDTVIAIPNGYFLSLENLWWVHSLDKERQNSAFRAYQDLLKAAWTEVGRCFQRGEDFDITVDDGHAITGYRKVVRLNLPGTARADQELARKILSDPTLRDVHQLAGRLLGSGLNAGSGYGEVWIRDLNTFIELALEVSYPARLREALLTFFKFQGPEGDIVDGYIPKDKASVGYKYRRSDLAEGFLAHKNTVETDQESSLVQAVAKYIRVTGDRSILREEVRGTNVLQRLGQALSYVLTKRWDAQHGLAWGATTADWGDVQPESPWGVELDDQSHRALDIYDNAMLVIAINNYIGLLDEDAPEVSRWRQTAADLKRNIRRHLWDAEKGKFIPHLYLAGSPFPQDFDENSISYHGGTAVAIEAGILSRDEVCEALRQMRANVRAAGAASLGLTVYPPYPRGYFKNPSMREPYSYQNGGDWCWFGGRMIQQLVAYGFVEDAYRELQPMIERAKRHGFHEWWSRDNEPRGSGQFRGSAGVLGRAIEVLQEWATDSAALEQ